MRIEFAMIFPLLTESLPGTFLGGRKRLRFAYFLLLQMKSSLIFLSFGRKVSLIFLLPMVVIWARNML